MVFTKRCRWCTNALFLTLLALVACNSGTGKQPPGDNAPAMLGNRAPEIVSISTGTQIRLTMDELVNVVLEVSDEQPAGLTFQAESSDPSVVTATSTLPEQISLSAGSPGRATVTINVTDAEGLSVDAIINVTVVDPAVDNSASNIIFATDFSKDADYSVTNAQLYQSEAPPLGWDGVLASTDSVITVVAGAGVNGSNALRLRWGSQAQPTISLVKHLTGNERTGYNELYIRYNVKLPNRFKAGSDGTNMNHWKWGRLWQNTSPANALTEAGRWTENRANSGYVVWGYNTGIPYTKAYAVFSENSGENLEQGSAGGPLQGIDWFVSGANRNIQDGYFESIGDGAWAFDPARPGFLIDNQQRYHTIEFRFKLASAESLEDGVFEIWYDGVKQDKWSRIRPSSSSVPERTGIPTINRGSGYNFFALFDNMAGWNSNWTNDDVDGYIDVSDVVISTEYIGHDYNVSGITDNTGGN